MNFKRGVLLFILLITMSLSVTAYDYESVDYENLYVRIDTINDIDDARNDLVNWVWKSGRINTTPSVSNITYTSIPNIDLDVNNIDEVFDYYYPGENFNYHTYYIKNIEPNNRLFVYACGHLGGDESGTDEMIDALLDNGYDVLIKNMPGRSSNVGYTDHDDVAELINATYNPMEGFFNDLYWSLNYISDNNNYYDISMTGISGGGWGTVWYSAIDERIENSYPVAGSYPRIIYDEVMSGAGDWEQGSVGTIVHDFLTTNVSYFDMYLLGASNGKQLAIYNEFDSCCFYGTHYTFYEDFISNRSETLDGSFDVYLTSSTTHQTTSDARALIISTNYKNFHNTISIKIEAINNTINVTLGKNGLTANTTNNFINFLSIIFGDIL